METAKHPTTKTTQYLVGECLVLFNDLFARHPEWTDNQLARFRSCISDLDVFGTGHASINYRLRDHSNIFDLLIRKLNGLKMILERIKDPADESFQPNMQEKATTTPEYFYIDGEEFVYESPSHFRRFLLDYQFRAATREQSRC